MFDAMCLRCFAIGSRTCKVGEASAQEQPYYSLSCRFRVIVHHLWMSAVSGFEAEAAQSFRV